MTTATFNGSWNQKDSGMLDPNRLGGRHAADTMRANAAYMGAQTGQQNAETAALNAQTGQFQAGTDALRTKNLGEYQQGVLKNSMASTSGINDYYKRLGTQNVIGAPATPGVTPNVTPGVTPGTPSPTGEVPQTASASPTGYSDVTAYSPYSFGDNLSNTFNRYG